MPPESAAAVENPEALAPATERLNTPITVAPIGGGGAVWQAAGITLGAMISLVLHGSVAAAMILWWAPRPGAIPVLTEAISIELVASAVIEAVHPSLSQESAASPSSAQSEAGSPKEAPASPEPLIDKPIEAATPAAPSDDAIATIKEAIAPPKTPTPEAPTELKRVEPLEAATQRPEQEVAARVEEALLPVPESLRQTPDLPQRAEPDPAPIEAPKVETPPPQPHKETHAVTEETRTVPARNKKANAPAKKGGEQSRARVGAARSSGRISASAGSAINYAALVRARVAARGPSGRAEMGPL